MLRLSPTLSLLPLLLAACGGSADRVFEISDIRVVTREIELGKGLIDRYSRDIEPAAGDDGGAAGGLDFTLPLGWVQRPASRFVMMSFGVPGGASCSVSKAGGTLLDNVNRWRRQFGHGPIDQAALADLPVERFGPGRGYLVELEGPFENRSGKIPDAKMFGLVMPVAMDESLFVKMTGPREAVEKQRASFLAIAASLRAPGRDPHAGGGAAAPGGTSMPKVTAPGGSAVPKLQWTIPSGWREVPSSQVVRQVTIRCDAHDDVECWVTTLAKDSGELSWNVNLWRRQVGAAELDATAVAALPTLVVLGGEATLVEAAGDKKALLGLIAPMPEHRVFVKLVGSPDAVQTCRADFVTFCESLREAE